MPRLKLEDLEIQAIDLCPEGDNPPARIMLFKNKGGTTGEDRGKNTSNLLKLLSNTKGGDAMPKTLAEILKEISDEDQKLVEESITSQVEKTVKEEVKKAVDEADVKHKEEMEAKDTEHTAAIEKLKGDGESDEDKDPIEKASPEIKAKFDLIEKERLQEKEDLKKARDDIAEMQKTAKRKEFVAKAKDYKGLSVKADEFGETLRKINQSVDADTFKQLDEVLEGANKLLEESGIFKEQGKGGGEADTNNAVEKVKKMVKIKMDNDKEGKLTKEAAELDVYNENPDLYQQYKTEKGV